MAQKGRQTRARHVHRGEVGGHADAVPLGDPAQHGRVVVREALLGVVAVERGERVEQQLARRDEAPGALREVVEVGRSEARRARIGEVLLPCELREELPEQRERVPVRGHVDVPRPDVIAFSDTPRDEPEGVRCERHARVEQQRQVRVGRFQARPARLEPAGVLLP